MNLASRSTWSLALPFAAALGTAPATQACAACFGRSDSPLAAGMNMGILSLLVVILLVLGGVAGFFVFLARRSVAAARAAADTASGATVSPPRVAARLHPRPSRRHARPSVAPHRRPHTRMAARGDGRDVLQGRGL